MCLLVAAFSISPAAAQEAPAEEPAATESVALETIKIEDEDDRAAARVEGTYLEEKQARDLRDTFKDTPQVVVGGAQRAAQKIYVRGLEDTNLNVTVDGARQAGYLFHHQTRLNIAPELLTQVNVEAGTGNALAGPGALGGALRFVTKDAEDLLLPGENWGSLVRGWYHANNDEVGGTLALYGRPAQSFSALGFLTLTQSNDYRAGGGESIPYSGGRPQSALLKFSYRPTEEHKITLGGNFTSDNAIRLTRANFGYSPGAITMERKLETLNTTLNYAYAPAHGLHALHVDAYAADSKLSAGSAGTQATFKSYGVTVADTVERGWGKVVFGLDANQDDAQAENGNNRGGEKGRILGAFAQSRFDVTARFRVGLGARFDDYQLEGVDGQKLSQSRPSPNASLGYQWTKSWSSTLSFRQAFRGPVPAEVFLLTNARSLAPAGDLKGTVAETTELANRFALEGLATVLDLSLYSTTLHNPLESSVNRTTGVVTRRNLADDLTVRGLEARAKKSFGAVDGSVFYTHSETKFGDRDMGYTGNFTRGVSLGDRVGAGLEWRLPDQGLTLNWNTNLVMKLTNVPAGALEQPGYDVHDVSATWFASERLRVSFAISNMFDKKYIAQGSWYAGGSGQESALYEPGRDFKLALSYQF